MGRWGNCQRTQKGRRSATCHRPRMRVGGSLATGIKLQPDDEQRAAPSLREQPPLVDGVLFPPHLPVPSSMRPGRAAKGQHPWAGIVRYRPRALPVPHRDPCLLSGSNRPYDRALLRNPHHGHVAILGDATATRAGGGGTEIWSHPRPGRARCASSTTGDAHPACRQAQLEPLQKSCKK